MSQPKIPSLPDESPSLRAAVRAIHTAHPRWHAFLSDAGRIWASTAHCPYIAGSGTTVDGGTAEIVCREIAQVEREWAALAA